MSKKNDNLPAQAVEDDSIVVFPGIDPEYLAMAQDAAKDQGMDDVAGSGYYYVTLKKNGKFFRGKDEIDQPFHMVVLNYGSGRRYFDGKYNQDEIKTPDCWTTSTIKNPNSNDLIPNTHCASVQNSTCAGCQHFEFGGDCKPEYRLAIFPVSGEGSGRSFKPTEYHTKEISIARLAPTSLKEWNAYVKSFIKNVEISAGQKQDLPTYFFIIEVTAEVTDEGYFLWKFRPTVPVDIDVAKQLKLKMADAEEAITQGYGLRGSGGSESHEDDDDVEVSDDIKAKV